MRRYFEGLWLLLLVSGFLTLASTGRLGWAVVTLAGAAWVARGIAFARGRQWTIPAPWWLAGAALYLPVYALDGWVLSHSFLLASLHWVVLAGAAKLFSPLNGREELLLGVLALLEVLTAALLTISGVFFLLFLIFLVLLIATLVAHEMDRAQAAVAQSAGPAGPRYGNAGPAAGPRFRYAGPAAARPRPLLRFSLLLSLGVAGCTVLIFFLLPRTALGLGAARPVQGLTGFSDDVHLGAIASLQRNDRPVMHIRLDGAQPPHATAAFARIPWRGRGLTSFDGQRWFDPDVPVLYGTQAGGLTVGRPPPERPAEIVRYQVMLEPLSSPVLFFPARLLRASTPYPVLAWDRATATLASPGTNFAGIAYSGISDLAQPPPQELRAAPPLSATLAHAGFAAYLQLPDRLDPRIPALARTITAHTAPDAWDRMQALSQYLQTHYHYTLDNLPQGPDPLATFLFDQPEGDCEYFASALAVMARTLGIPTRLVNGFLLGGYNPLSGEYLVRGSDAHTWVETFFPAATDARGRRFGDWVSFDATPSAPAPAAFWPGADLVFDALSSFWQEWIVNYDWLRQGHLAARLQDQLNLGVARLLRASRAARAGITRGGQAAWQGLAHGPAARSERLGAAALAVLAGILALTGTRRRWNWPQRWQDWGWVNARPSDTRQQARRAYRRFQRYLARRGIARAPAHTAQDLLAALAARDAHAPLVAAAADFLATYEAMRFGAAATDAARLRLELETVRRLF